MKLYFNDMPEETIYELNDSDGSTTPYDLDGSSESNTSAGSSCREDEDTTQEIISTQKNLKDVAAPYLTITRAGVIIDRFGRSYDHKKLAAKLAAKRPDYINVNESNEKKAMVERQSSAHMQKESESVDKIARAEIRKSLRRSLAFNNFFKMFLGYHPDLTKKEALLLAKRKYETLTDVQKYRNYGFNPEINLEPRRNDRTQRSTI